MNAIVSQSPAQTALNRAMIRWSLSKATLVSDTETSWVYRVEQSGSKPAAVKILKPHAGDDEMRGGELLAWYAGEGAVTVFDFAEDAVLTEWVDGNTLGEVARAGRDEEATEAFGHVVSQLHLPRTDAPNALMPLRERFQPLFKSDARLWPNTARDLYARAMGIGLSLFDKPQVSVPLHGDLHHDNILMSPRGWLAIDPKGLIGDPAYDLANAFLNPWNAPSITTKPGRIAHMVDSFSARLGYSRKRILGFAAAHAALSACWDIEAGNPVSHQMAMLPVLLTAYNLA